MRKFLAIFFLTLFTVNSTEAGQLLKLPFLITHFNEHIREGRSHSLYDFLSEHYAGNHENDNDSDEDSQLPFKTMNVISFGNVFLKTSIEDIEISIPVVIISLHTYQADPGLSNFHAEIFHPPNMV